MRSAGCFGRVVWSAAFVAGWASAAPALAADAPNAYAPWAGFYAGVVYGGGASTVNSSQTASRSVTGWGQTSGAVVGYNFQTGRYVYGAEGDLSFHLLRPDDPGVQPTLSRRRLRPTSSIRRRPTVFGFGSVTTPGRFSPTLRLASRQRESMRPATPGRPFNTAKRARRRAFRSAPASNGVSSRRSSDRWWSAANMFSTPIRASPTRCFPARRRSAPASSNSSSASA